MAALRPCERMPESLLVIGAGHAAGQLVASLVQRKADYRITLVGDETSLPYQRPPLSKKFLSGEIEAERLLVRPEAFYEDPSIEVHRDSRIASIDRSARTAEADDGRKFDFDKLVLATGSRARTLQVPGAELDGVHTLRSIADVERIRARLVPGKRLAVIGAGYIGMEVAAVAIGMGLSVTVIETCGRVMARSVSPLVSDVYAEVHRDHGVGLILDGTVIGFSGTDKVAAVDLADGRSIAADAVIVGIGAIPNIELAESSGLDTGDGIIVDPQCRTSDPDILAIGDCTRHPNPLLGTDLRLESVQNALEQAKTAAAVLCGEDAEYAQVPWFWSDQYDLKLQIAGISGEHDETVIRGSVASRQFSCLYLANGRLLAIDAINRPMDFVQAKPLIAERRELDRVRLEDARTPLKDCVA